MARSGCIGAGLGGRSDREFGAEQHRASHRRGHPAGGGRTARGAIAISNGPREVALGGAFLLVLIGGAMLLMKKPQVKKA